MFIKPEEKKSSFLNLEKDTNIILTKMLSNETLKRLLFFNTKDAIKKRNLTEEETHSLIGRNIKNVPKLEVDSDVLTYVIINFDNFTQSDNPEFRDNMIEFDIICHLDQWELDNLQLRPYKIAGEIDSMINNKKMTGIGEIRFVGASQILLNSEFGGICLMYQTVHGHGEDEKFETTAEYQNIEKADAEQYLKNLLDG